jgi:hypothetical protein
MTGFGAVCTETEFLNIHRPKHSLNRNEVHFLRNVRMNDPTTNTAQMLETASIGVSATFSSVTAGAGFSNGTLFLDILSPI